MVEARWNGAVLARSNRTIVIEGNHYFPPDSVDKAYLRPSDTISECPWKGTARYCTVKVGERENPDAVWYYPDPRPAARDIRDRLAFWKGVQVIEIA